MSEYNGFENHVLTFALAGNSAVILQGFSTKPISRIGGLHQYLGGSHLYHFGVPFFSPSSERNAQQSLLSQPDTTRYYWHTHTLLAIKNNKREMLLHTTAATGNKKLHNIVVVILPPMICFALVHACRRTCISFSNTRDRKREKDVQTIPSISCCINGGFFGNDKLAPRSNYGLLSLYEPLFVAPSLVVIP